MKYHFTQLKALLLFFFFVCFSFTISAQRETSVKSSRNKDLDLILKVLPPDRPENGRVSYLDETFEDWLDRTGELPPDFDQLPSIPFLPDPLVLGEGTMNILVKTREQWNEKRVWMKEQLMKYITGTVPPAPDNLKATILSSRLDGNVTLQMVELSFGPEQKAKLTLELMIPPGDGPFPVFLTQWNHREWAQVAVRRGYIGCIYAGADAKDDTEEYSRIWAGQYDFTRLMRRAYGASRAIDYLYTLSVVDKEKIAITGHSRNGKLSLIAAAFDERIGACIPSSGGTGAEVSWRFCSHNYDIEDIALLASAQPSWLHPRLRFFIGREHKLPVDQNSLMALIAPRGLMLSTALSEGASNPWGIEQAFHASEKVYNFLGKKENLAIRSRNGLHSVSARDMEDYIDFFDFVFGRSTSKPENRLFYNYSFDKWLELSGEKINVNAFPEKLSGHTFQKGGVKSTEDWKTIKTEVVKQINWVLGDKPPGVTNPGPGSIDRSGGGETNFGTYLIRPPATAGIGRMNVSPYSGFGDQLFGYLYYPLDKQGEIISKNLPVVIYLHEYDYSKGFNSYHQIQSIIKLLTDKGFAVFTYDMIGFGNRIEEGTRFYHRYPNWSKMGKMVTDVIGAVDALANLDVINEDQIIVAGYSLGGNVGLHAAVLDERIAGVVSVAGFTPMRSNTLNRGTEGIMAFSHLHGLMPRLGFFIDNEARIPYDYNELIASIAPRPILVVAPKYDKDAHLKDIEQSIRQAGGIYELYQAATNIHLIAPEDINRFPVELMNEIAIWLEGKFK